MNQHDLAQLGLRYKAGDDDEDEDQEAPVVDKQLPGSIALKRQEELFFKNRTV